MKKGGSNKEVPTTMQSLDAQEQANQTFANIRGFLSDYEREHQAHSIEIQQWWEAKWKERLNRTDMIWIVDRIGTAQGFPGLTTG